MTKLADPDWRGLAEIEARHRTSRDAAQIKAARNRERLALAQGYGLDPSNATEQYVVAVVDRVRRSGRPGMTRSQILATIGGTAARAKLTIALLRDYGLVRVEDRAAAAVARAPQPDDVARIRATAAIIRARGL